MLVPTVRVPGFQLINLMSAKGTPEYDAVMQKFPTDWMKVDNVLKYKSRRKNSNAGFFLTK